MKLNRRMFLATTASAAVLTSLAACAKNPDAFMIDVLQETLGNK